MNKIFNISFHNSKNILDLLKHGALKVVWFFGKNAFLFILIFIALSMLLGEFLFYKYVYLVKISEPEISLMPTKFNKQVYDSVLEEWEYRETIFKNTLRKNYINPFK